ncbi:MAG: hypothetical protein V2A75_07010 [Pseudomonadota bacterium]
MKKIFLLLITIFMVIHLQANDSFNSEASHVIGGAVIAGAITAVVDGYYPEYKDNRGMIGFGISSVAMIVHESITIAIRGDAKGQILDAAMHIAGSAVGAFITDKYILAPVINDSPVEGKYVGLTLQHSF